MKQIDEYIESLYRNARNTREVKDLKEEMRVHLLDSVEELQEQGYSEEESIRIAIERFGEANKMIKELTELNVIRRTIAKWLFRIALIMGIAGVLVLFSYRLWNENFSYNLRHSVTDQISQQILQHGTGSDLTKEAISKIIDENTSGISAVGYKTYPVGESNLANRGYDFLYPSSVPLDQYGEFEVRDTQSGFIYESRFPSLKRLQETNEELIIDVRQWQFTETFYFTGIGLLFGYWMLFTVWAITNLLYNRKGSKTWMVIICLFNFVGYWLYLDQIKAADRRRSYTWIRIFVCLFGAYVVSKGIKLLTYKDRGVNVSIKEIGIYVPLNTHSLMVYGSSFTVVGLLFITASFLFKSKKKHC